MRLARRLTIIAAKAAHLLALVVMIRCLGPEAAECVCAGVRSARLRIAVHLRSLRRPVPTPAP